MLTNNVILIKHVDCKQHRFDYIFGYCKIIIKLIGLMLIKYSAIYNNILLCLGTIEIVKQENLAYSNQKPSCATRLASRMVFLWLVKPECLSGQANETEKNL